VQALAKAHDLLVRGEMRSADLHELVGEQVAFGTNDPSRISLAGPPVKLDSRSAVQMALVLHELATNACRFGALSVPSGRLFIGWQVEAGPMPRLVLEWTERNVPEVSAPSTRGFGSTLIERSLEALGGETNVRYNADGLTCTIRMPLPEVEERLPDHGGWSRAASHGRSDPAQEAAPDLKGRRILVVEDEPLVSMDIEAQLGAAGAMVVGPAAAVDQALQLIAEASFDVALLDANLGGHAVDEIAAALRRKNVPFAFATGYTQDTLPASFRDARILSKPFSGDQLLSTVAGLLADRGDPRRVLALRGRSGPGRP
jgi:CheY-like chemotaxis protein